MALALGVFITLPNSATASSFGPPGTTAPATASGSHFNISNANYGMVSHVCQASTSSYKGVSGVFCADLEALPAGGKNVNVYAMDEEYCQGNGTLPECTQANAYYYYEFDNDAEGPFLSIATCGVHTGAGNCNTGARNYFWTNMWTLNNDGDCHYFQVFVDGTLEATSHQSQIELPGDKWTSLYLQTATPSVKICDEM